MAKNSKRGRNKAPPRVRRKALAPRPAARAPEGIEARRIDLVMRAVNEGVYDWDIAKGTIYYSEGVHRATGMSPRHIRTPEDWRNRIHPEDLPSYDAALIAHFKGKTERFECDYRFRDRKGGWRWARQHGIAERDADGRAVRLVGSTGDITGLKHAEQSLREAQERLALATQAATEGIYEWNLATGSLYLSDRAKAYFAVKGRKLTPAAWNALVHKEDFARYRAAIAAFFKSRRMQFEHEYRLRKPGGGHCWILDRSVALRDAKGRVTRLVGAIADITQRKEAEIELRRARDAATEALEQQTATAEVLASISASLSDTQPVFDAIARNVLRLLNTRFSAVQVVRHGQLHLAGFAGPGFEKLKAYFPQPVDADTAATKALKAHRVVQIVPIIGNPQAPQRSQKIARSFGYNAIITVPMMREGKVIGAIATTRREAVPFDAKQEALLKTFADQAVIAIENVRLFNETREALERQTATAEILRAISSSPSDIRPIFETLVKAAARFCGAPDVVIFSLDGNMLHGRAACGKFAEILVRQAGGVQAVDIPVNRASVSGRAVAERRLIHVHDLAAEPEDEYPAGRDMQRRFGHRSMVAAPLLREGLPLGAIALFRAEVKPFSDRQLALLQIFADQAVIAIENVRMFNETKEALERQRATSDVLASISGSMADTQPVFDRIVQNVRRLFGTRFAVLQLLRSDGMVEMPAIDGDPAYPAFAKLRERYPRPLDDSTVGGHAMLSKQAFQLAPVIDNPATPPATVQFARDFGFNSVIFSPMIHEGKVIGALGAAHHDAKPFDDRQVALIKTFADQAVIAIQNARLFNETREALERQTATAQILGAMSGSMRDAKPVFEAIVRSCSSLFPGSGVTLRLLKDGILQVEANVGMDAGPVPVDRGSAIGACVLDARTVHLPDLEAAVAEFPRIRHLGLKYGYHSGIYAPLLREGVAIGTIAVLRPEIGGFSEKDVTLFNTFADQAVIAIENVRLFNETKEALEQQRASAGVLNVISSSVADAAPVFKAIGSACQQLFASDQVVISQVGDDGMVRHVLVEFTAQLSGESTEHGWTALNEGFPRPLEKSYQAYPIRKRRVIHYPDMANGPGVPEAMRVITARVGNFSMLIAPMLWEEKGIGTIHLVRVPPRPFSDKEAALLKTFADQAVIAIQNARLFNETKEALERQTATAEILGVISSSPTDTQPVFEKIAELAIRLCEASVGGVLRFDGQLIHIATLKNVDPNAGDAMIRAFPMPPSPRSGASRSVLMKRIVHIPDVFEDPEYGIADAAQAGGFRCVLAVPLLRGDLVVGTIAVGRPKPVPFSERQIELLKTFADQAVIAIENVRLFNETREGLEQQTAIGEILRVIANSPADVQPVLEAVAQRAARICDASDARIFLVEGSHFRPAAGFGDVSVEGGPRPLTRGSPSGRAIIDRARQHIEDITALPVDEFPVGRPIAERSGWRAILSVPLLREDRALGTIALRRKEARRFTDKQIALLETFADQAAIAIENVRLFNETKEALERQTATAGILRVISGSPASVQPVFDSILQHATRLCEAHLGFVFTSDGKAYDPVAQHGLEAERYAAWRAAFAEHRIPGPLSGLGRLLRGESSVHIADVADEDAYRARDPLRVLTVELIGARTFLAVPLVKDSAVIGAVVMYRREVRPFGAKQIALLQTFADQAVIAIENVRLFNETKEALERQTATAEILKVIADSPSDVQPVLEAVASSAGRLCEAKDVIVLLREGDHLRYRVHHGDIAPAVSVGDTKRISRDWSAGRCAAEARQLHIHDILSSPGEFPDGSRMGKHAGYRTVLMTPLLREGNVLGVIGMRRAEVRPFEPRQIELINTFADQAVIAIENVRLFNETKAALERQTATAEILRVISGSPTDAQPVFEAIARNVWRLCDGLYTYVGLFDGEMIRFVAHHNVSPQARGILDARFPSAPTRGSSTGAAILERRAVHIPDVLADPAYVFKDLAQADGYRAILAVPMLREGTPIGVIAVGRRTPFSDDQIELVRTFADQGVIAIENVRLFRELQSRTDALTKSVGQLTALGEVGRAISSTLDLEALLNIVVAHAMQLTGLDAGVIYEYDAAADRFELRASKNFGDVTGLRGSQLRVGEGAVGGSVAAREAKQVPDTHAPDYPARLRELLDREGFRAILAVPLLREEQVIGALMMLRKAPGEFAPDVVEMLKTFASQSALAIQNARLFREIAEKGRQLEEASRHKSNFLASMSHELRTPLNAILGFNEMILGQVYGEVPADMAEPLNDIQTSGKHLLRLINNVLDLAKIEAGRMELSLSDYSVQDTVESVRSTLRPLAAEKGLEFVASVPNDLPLACGDGGRITQCLMNLAGNSIKFTKAGKVEISAGEKDGLLTYRVADTGIGIPPDKIASLFTEFKQTDATIASEYGGTGLGLSISKKFVEMHGGRIWIESELGKGSTFIIEVPLRVKTA